MSTISQRITRIIGEPKLPEITIKRRRSKNANTTPYKKYDSQVVIKTLSDPSHWEITMYNKKVLPPMDYGANDKNTEDVHDTAKPYAAST